MSLAKLPGLGAKSAQQLSAVGIESEQQLRELGAISAFVRLA
jgi:recombinational DNA repair protein RecR